MIGCLLKNTILFDWKLLRGDGVVGAAKPQGVVAFRSFDVCRSFGDDQ